MIRMLSLGVATLVLAGSWCAASTREEDEAAYPREAVANIDAWMPLHCRDDVRAALVKIWEECGKGSSSQECAFRIDSMPLAGGDNRLEIVFMGPDVTPDSREAFKRTIDVVRGKTIAIVHTHPDATEPGIGVGDDQVPVPLNYVLHGRRGGLYVWDRDLGATRRPIRAGMSWKNPCAPRDLERGRARLRRIRDLKAAR